MALNGLLCAVKSLLTHLLIELRFMFSISAHVKNVDSTGMPEVDVIR